MTDYISLPMTNNNIMAVKASMSVLGYGEYYSIRVVSVINIFTYDNYKYEARCIIDGTSDGVIIERVECDLSLDDDMIYLLEK